MVQLEKLLNETVNFWRKWITSVVFVEYPLVCEGE